MPKFERGEHQIEFNTGPDADWQVQKGCSPLHVSRLILNEEFGVAFTEAVGDDIVTLTIPTDVEGSVGGCESFERTPHLIQAGDQIIRHTRRQALN
jgi:hypothetical protein